MACVCRSRFGAGRHQRVADVTTSLRPSHKSLKTNELLHGSFANQNRQQKTGHPLFEALRRHTLDRAREPMGQGACFFSLDVAEPVRIDFYRAGVVDGLGDVNHERLSAVELGMDGPSALRDPGVLGNLVPALPPADLPTVARLAEPRALLNEHALVPFLEEVRSERVAEVERIRQQVGPGPAASRARTARG
jgi:hypothetical protein